MKRRKKVFNSLGCAVKIKVRSEGGDERGKQVPEWRQAQTPLSLITCKVVPYVLDEVCFQCVLLRLVRYANVTSGYACNNRCS